MQHASLTIQRWLTFTRDQQLLMIANEMNRASKLLAQQDLPRLAAGYERVLRLVDLTVETRPRRGLCRELLRWRDLVAELYVSQDFDATRHRQIFYALLRLVPATALQIPFLLPGRTELPSTAAAG